MRNVCICMMIENTYAPIIYKITFEDTHTCDNKNENG